jgi:chemotaxis protein CheX
MMTTVKPEISDPLIQDCIVQSVRKVFQTMMGHDVSFVEQLGEETLATPHANALIIGSVGFIGVANGLIYLCFSEQFAKVASGRMLGMSMAEIELQGNAVINDAIGEITNMTVGGFKNTLCDMGFPCKLTLPAIVRGSNLSIAAVKSATRHVFRFDCTGHRFVADIQLKIE